MSAPPFWRPALAAACGPLSGLGLARFAFVPLFPAMVAGGWVNGEGAGLLGAANMAGYLAGVLTSRPLGLRLGTTRTLNLGMALTALALGLCALNWGLWWFLPWRFLAGVSGGLLMGLAGPATQAVVAPERRGRAGGIVIGGVGMGIATSSLLVPALVPLGLAWAWGGLALLVLALWAFASGGWPDARVAPAGGVGGARIGGWLVVTSYGLSAAGLVPPMIYLADMAVRGRGLPLEQASGLWLLFGLGGLLGTLSSGTLADRLGPTRAYRLWLVVQVVALALCLPPQPWMLVPAALACGYAALGITAVVLAVARERAGAAAAVLWTRTTVAFGVGQSALAFVLARLFALSGESHLLLFSVGLGISLLALGVALGERRRGQR